MPFLERFLIARKWDVTAARDMIATSANWRNKTGLDTAPLFPSPMPVLGYEESELIALRGCGVRPTNQELDTAHAQLAVAASASWHKWDKGGRPVYIDRVGQTRVHELVERATALAPPGGDAAKMLVDVHVHSNEVGGVLVEARNKVHAAEGKPPVHAVTAIMDCRGLTMGSLYGPALDLLKAQSAHDQAHYAEGLYRVYAVNCPTMVTFVWGIVRHWMDPRVQQKVFLLGEDETKAALLEAIDAENLPEFLGGKCRCGGAGAVEGCCPPVDDAAAAALTKGGTQSITVGAGKAHTIFQRVDVGEKMRVAIMPAQDLNFELTLQPDPLLPPEGGAAPTPAGAAVTAPPAETVLPKKKLLMGVRVELTLTSTKPGMFRFNFDNTHSWFKTKDFTFRIEKVEV
jgi:hypothetical protein